MAVIHVAWLKFKDDIGSARIEHHLSACRLLVGRVPALGDLKCGPSFTDRAGGLTHCIVVTVADRAALAAYLQHPEHAEVAGALKADLAELRVMDIEA